MKGRMLAALAVVLLFAAADRPASGSGAHARLHVTTDRSQLVVLPDEPFTKLAIANPGVADVAVINPTQFVLNGKAPGVTTLIVIYPSRVRSFDVVVTPPPIGAVGARLVSEPHGVVVHRAGTGSVQVFARDQRDEWVELGTVKLEADPAKK